MRWKEMDWFKSGEHQVVHERLRELDKQGIVWCPGRGNIYRAHDLTPFESVRVVLVGQDPYPNPDHATGLAFGIPKDCKKIPPTLAMIMQELQSDVDSIDIARFDRSLEHWAAQGVLLWNVIPSCEAHSSGSHKKWEEYEWLTQEMFNKLSADRYVVFAFLGSTASHYSKYVNENCSDCLYTSHPSPRGNMNSFKPFLGSRIFSTINACLHQHGKTPIDWR